MQQTLDTIETLKKELEDAKKFLNLSEMATRRDGLAEQMNQPGFWDDQAHAQKISREHGLLENTITSWEEFEENVKYVDELSGVINEVKDEEEFNELKEKTTELQQTFEKLEIQLYLNGKYDQLPVLLSVHAGAGGTDAQDWGEMVLRMYTRYAESKGWKTELLERSDGEEAGLKSATIRIEGDFTYGFLKEEAGAHRLVRLSPFNIKHTRETSFCLVEVMPEIEAGEVEIKDEDLKVDVYRASGHGGQSVNTTDSAVRIKHLPTGIVVQCQNERSQLQNKQQAMKALASKLVSLKEQHHLEELGEIKGEHVEGSWGNQIRSYVMHPYQMVKDHRTKHESKQIEAVLDGDTNEIDLFIERSLKSHKESK
ncbi:peptide chain release factor 2 [Candidatus Peregrinibacteria bacterium]|jgi:peptide chain release factor 2|nr:peptide chain release factor 2 [Candidatus Peregrinibacteria bacterium]MBT7702913.1 peptide chain release factor 2 [Candidatus Peregrinibacteria bacterium]